MTFYRFDIADSTYGVTRKLLTTGIFADVFLENDSSEFFAKIFLRRHILPILVSWIYVHIKVIHKTPVTR